MRTNVPDNKLLTNKIRPLFLQADFSKCELFNFMHAFVCIDTQYTAIVVDDLMIGIAEKCWQFDRNFFTTPCLWWKEYKFARRTFLNFIFIDFAHHTNITLIDICIRICIRLHFVTTNNQYSQSRQN